jgi:hypothetical protein
MAAGESGAGLTIEAPGDPVPVDNGTEALDCGDTRPRIWANAGAQAKRKIPTAAMAKAPRRDMSKPHPDIAIFLDPNRGNFKPVSARRRPRRPSAASCCLADSPSLSPYLGTRSVGGFAYGDAQ